MGKIFQILFYQPIFNILIVFYDLFKGNLGLAIIAVAVLSRLVTYPITKAQIKAAEKGKEFQKKFADVKKKYGKNKEKLNEEMAKLQAKYLPSQLSGCLPIIILIILLIQIRGGIVNLVDKGWNAFNEISYFSSLKKEEDSITFSPGELAEGKHTFKVKVVSSEGRVLEKEYFFEVVTDLKSRADELVQEEKDKGKDTRKEEATLRQNEVKAERETDISLYNSLFAQNRVSLPIGRFVIFTTESVPVYLMTDTNPTFEFYVRPPSNQTIVSQDTKVYFDSSDVTDKSTITQGEKINLNFIGIDLSKVAADFSWSNPKIIPYVILALLVGGSQYFSTQIMTGLKPVETQKKEVSKKKKKKDDVMPDMSDMMGSMNKQMMFLFPLLTIITSLGYWGGANLFPAGLSIFWTIQSIFVIMQQSMTNKEKTIQWLKGKFFSRKSKEDV